MKKISIILFVSLSLFVFFSLKCFAYVSSKWEGSYSASIKGDDSGILMFRVDNAGQVKDIRYFSALYDEIYGKEEGGFITEGGMYKDNLGYANGIFDFLLDGRFTGLWVNKQGHTGKVFGWKNTTKLANYSGKYKGFVFGDDTGTGSLDINNSGIITGIIKTKDVPNGQVPIYGIINDIGIFIVTAGESSFFDEFQFASVGDITNGIIIGPCFVNNKYLGGKFIGFKQIPIIHQGILSQEQISQLYVAIFGRASEGEGNVYWQSNNHTMAETADIMLGTAAAKDYFGETLNDNRAFIEFIYKNTLGKTYEQDPTGVDYWISRLDQGESKGAVSATLIKAAMDPAYKGLPSQERFINRVKISNFVASNISVLPDINDLDSFADFIKDVDHSPESLSQAKEKIFEYVASLFAKAI